MDAKSKNARLALIAGDEDFTDLIQTILASDAIELWTLGNGRAALDRLRQDLPDLVILDLALPDMNGWEFFMQMQSDDGGPSLPRQVPVIILANQASRVDRTFGLRVAQVHDFIVKPFLPTQLRKSVEMALGWGASPQYRHPVSQYAS